MFTGIRGMNPSEMAEAIAREIRKADTTLGVKVADNRVLVDINGKKLRIEIHEIRS